MSKKGPLSTAERFYIEQQAFTMEVANIAINLDRTVSQVQEYKNEWVANKSRAGGQFARQKGVTLMTKGASEMGDTHRASLGSKPTGRPNSITTCKKKQIDS
jgi:hypothetical protein